MTELLEKYNEKKDFIEKRAEQLKSRGLNNESLIFSLIEKEIKNDYVVPKKLNSKQKKILEEFAEVSGDEIKHVERGLFDRVKDAMK